MPVSSLHARDASDIGDVQTDNADADTAVDDPGSSPRDGQTPTETDSTDKANSRKRAAAQNDDDGASATDGLDAMKAKVLAAKSRRAKKKKS